MDEQSVRLEAQVEQLAARVVALEKRLAALEAHDSAGAAVRAHSLPSAEELDGAASLTGLRKSDLPKIVAALGRTLVILAGAYLLRALTDAGVLPAGPGALAGGAFALVWLVVADRVGARGHTAHATFHGAAFVLIAFPLLFETTTRFHFLSPTAAAAALGGCTAVALAVAAHRALLGLAWVTTVGALGTAVALMLFTANLGPFASFLVLLGVATLWLGYVLEWKLLRWPVALVADLTILVLSGRVVTSGANDAPGVALTVQILLLVAYLGSVATRTLFLNRGVIPFEVVQSVAAILVGLGGAAYVTHTTGVGTVPVGMAALVLAGGCYGVAVAFVERRQGRRRNFVFYTSAGLVFALVGSALVMPTPALALVYAALGLASAWAGRLSRRVAFHAHGSVYLAAAVAVSGLTGHAVYGLGLPIAPTQAVSPAMLGVLAACLLAVGPLGPSPAENQFVATRAPRLVVLVIGVGGLLGVAVAWMAPALAGGEGAAPHASLVATLRTAVLVLTILVLAWAGGAKVLVEGAWLVYPLLAVTGLKFLLEDFRAGQPATLFLSFALYGLALIAGPWLCRQRSDSDTEGRRLPERPDRTAR